jgi:hypothetical protein
MMTSNPNEAFTDRRSPAWTDRILYKGNGIVMMEYHRFDSKDFKFTDHRPGNLIFFKFSLCDIYIPFLKINWGSGQNRLHAVTQISPQHGALY